MSSIVSGNCTSLEAMTTLVYDGAVSAGKMGLHAADIAINEYAIPVIKKEPMLSTGLAFGLVSAALFYSSNRDLALLHANSAPGRPFLDLGLKPLGKFMGGIVTVSCAIGIVMMRFVPQPLPTQHG